MANKRPERLSFHEIRSLLGNVKPEEVPLKLVGRDVAVLRNGNGLFNALVQTGTPYIIEDCRLGYINSGNVSLTVNLIEHSYGKGTFAFISPGSIIQINRMSDDFNLSGMMVSNERLKAALGATIPLWCSGEPSFFKVMLQPDNTVFVENLLDMVWRLINVNDFPDETLNGLIHAIIHYYGYLKELASNETESGKSRGKEMFDMFIRLVNANAKHERKLAFYADKMCVTSRYLGTVVKKMSGITAKEWIDRAVVTNAKVMLKYGSRQVAEISYELGFPTPSFFCKYFRHATGMTPQEYRKLRIKSEE